MNNKILFVDDEVNILSAIKRGLMGEDFECYFATDGEKALKILEEENMAVVVTDMRMPGMDGLKLLKKVKEKDADITRVVLSGYTQIPQILATVNRVGVFKFIAKPWDMENEFIYDIQEAVDYYNLKKEAKELKKNLQIRTELYQKLFKEAQEKTIYYQHYLEDVKKSVCAMIRSAIPTENFETEKQIKEMEDLFQKYIEILPLQQVEFSIKDFLDELKEKTSSLISDECIRFGSYKEKHGIYRGKKDLILFVMVIFLQIIKKEELGCPIQLMMNINEIYELSYKFQAIVFFRIYNDIPEEQEVSKLIHIIKVEKIWVRFIEEICKYEKIEYKIEKTQEGMKTIFSIDINKVEE